MSDMTILCEPPAVVASNYAFASFDTIEEARDAVPDVLEQCESNDDNRKTHGPSPKNFSTVNDMKYRILFCLLKHGCQWHRAHLFPHSKMTDEQKKNYKLAEQQLKKDGLIRVDKKGRGHTVRLVYQPSTDTNPNHVTSGPIEELSSEIKTWIRQEIRVGFVGLRSEILKNIDPSRNKYPLLTDETGGD